MDGYIFYSNSQAGPFLQILGEFLGQPLIFTYYCGHLPLAIHTNGAHGHVFVLITHNPAVARELHHDAGIGKVRPARYVNDHPHPYKVPAVADTIRLPEVLKLPRSLPWGVTTLPTFALPRLVVVIPTRRQKTIKSEPCVQGTIGTRSVIRLNLSG